MAILKCGKCGRTQSIVAESKSGGITEKEAEHIGWRMIGGRWECPFCTGNTANLRKIIGDDPDGEGKEDRKER